MGHRESFSFMRYAYPAQECMGGGAFLFFCRFAVNSFFRNFLYLWFLRKPPRLILGKESWILSVVIFSFKCL